MTDYSTWTSQRLFNKVAKHLFWQNARCVDKSGHLICYNKNNGSRCAYGCLIPKHDYITPNDTKSGYVINNIVDNIITSENYELMYELMTCHDRVKPSKWPCRLRAIARKFNLTTPVYLRKDVCGR